MVFSLRLPVFLWDFGQEAGGPGTWIAVAPSDPAALVAGRRFGRVILERRGAILWDLVKVLNSRSDSHVF